MVALCTELDLLSPFLFDHLASMIMDLTGQLQMASLSLYPQFETNLMSNRKVIELLLQLKSTKTHGKNYRLSQNKVYTFNEP